jgi:hypothetical protein
MPGCACHVLQSDLALLTVPEEAFWTDLRPLEFIKETPELQVGTRGSIPYHHLPL